MNNMNLPRNRWLALGVIFAATILIIARFSGLLAFPIFNDEAIYIQYAQLMAADFSQFKFVSIDNVFHDWKPPLQYWLGSIIIDWFDNPLLSVRFLSAVFWLFGGLGIYFLAAGLWTKKEGLLAALFYFLNPSVFFYGGQFIAEVYVWTIAIWLFVCLAGLLRRPAAALRAGLIVGGAAAGAALLLAKQAGFLYFYLAWLWPLFFKFFPSSPTGGRRAAADSGQWRRNSLTAWAVLAGGFIIYKLVIPAKLFFLESQYTGRWSFSLKELLSWPAEAWSANLRLVWDLFIHYYSPAVLVLAAVFSVWAVWRRNREDILISAMFWLASLAVVFGLRGFNEYIYGTAVIVFLAAILGRSASVLASWRPAFGWRFLFALGAAFFCFILIFWVLQIYLLKTNPAGYLDRGTAWLRGNNLLSWANGFNVPILVEMLRQQPDPSVAFVDPQWGNPGTALQIFQKYYPQVRIGVISPDLLQPEFLNQLAVAGFKSRLAIFSKNGNAPDLRRQWQEGLEANLCGSDSLAGASRRLDFRTHSEQTPVVICIF